LTTRSKIEIKDLLFKDFTETFNSAFLKAISKLDFSDEQIIKKLSSKKFSSKMRKLISSYENTVTHFYLKNNKYNLDDFLNIHLENQRTIVRRNKKSFTPFILYIYTCVKVYEKIIDNVSQKETDITLRLTISLYGLTIRRAQQIVDLLIDGYIDGAMIIWRSMYENAVLLMVLASEDNVELSQRFYDHSIKNSKRKVTSYTENHKALKFRPLPNSTFTILEEEKKKLISKYGKEFLENEYGWADILFKGKANFKLLEEKVEMNIYRPYYLLCSEQIHSNFNGFRNFMESNEIILPRFLKQESELQAFIDPMQFTISVLHEINDYVMWEFSTKDEHNANLLFLRMIFEKLQNSYSVKTKKKGSPLCQAG
jgi:hypothetical protein